MFQIEVDSNNSVIGFNSGDGYTQGYIDYDGEIPEDFFENFLNYKYVDGKLVFDSGLVSKNEARELIAECKYNLQQTDYVAIKIAEGVATPNDYADILEQRRNWRAQINELEGTL